MIRPSLLLFTLAAAWAADPWDALAAAAKLPESEAKTALEKLLLENPGFHAARFNLGSLLLTSDPAKAAEQLELATGATSTEIAADAWHNLTLARVKQGRLEDALLAAEKAATLRPDAAPLRDEVRRLVLARQDEARRKAEEEAKKLHLQPVPLPVARVGEAYTAKLPIAGGKPPATATLAGESKLPDGLTLAPDGTFAGTPTKSGSFALDIALKDASGEATGKTTLNVLPAPAITTERLPEAVIRQPYKATVSAVGLDAPVKWTFARLPAGLTGSADGTISGTPTEAGTASVHVHVEDGKRQANRILDLEVSDAFAPAEQPLPAATANAAYTFRATVRGPVQDYTWAAGPGAALTVAKDGTISGTPSQPGELKLPVKIAAADGRSREVDLSLPVNPAPLIQPDPITLHVGEPVDQALKATGGTPPFAWTVAGGGLPAGIRLDADGHLRGVAKDPGTATATVALVDRWKASTQAEITLKVEAATNPPPDQAKQDQQDQKDQKDQKGGKDDQKQAGQDKKQDQKDGQDKKDGQKPDDKKDGDQKQAGKPEDKKDGDQAKDGKEGKTGESKDGKADTPEAQAAVLNQTAADRWLDQLPKEDRGVLRYQLLEGGDKTPDKKGKTW